VLGLFRKLRAPRFFFTPKTYPFQTPPFFRKLPFRGFNPLNPPRKRVKTPLFFTVNGGKKNFLRGKTFKNVLRGPPRNFLGVLGGGTPRGGGFLKKKKRFFTGG